MPDNRAISKQDWETPWEFIKAVGARFGKLAWDLAARDDNAKAGRYFTPEQDSLSQDWSRCKGNRWCNPPFKIAEPWVAKAWETEQALHARRVQSALCRPAMDFTIMLTLASIGSCWFANYVHGKALVLGLSPRLTFVGQTQSYTKDLMLSVYGVAPGFDVWRWK